MGKTLRGRNQHMSGRTVPASTFRETASEVENCAQAAIDGGDLFGAEASQTSLQA